MDGGIELGMTARQIALVSQSTEGAVSQYAYLHGRKMGDRSQKATARNNRRWTAHRLRQQYFAGDAPDTWGRNSRQDEVEEIVLE